MKTWTLKFASLNKPDDIFDLIVSGKKIVETRSRNPNDGERDYTNIKPGDILHFISLDTGRTLDKQVISNHVYDSVTEMLKNEDVELILPGISTRENYLDQLEIAKYKWGQKYSFELEHYGIVAIAFK